MKPFIYLFIMFFSFSGMVNAQSDNFEARIKEIKNDIEIITKQEKATLEEEVAEINAKLNEKKITASEAEIQKRAKAEACADRIESRIEPLERELQRLVKGEVEAQESDEDMIEDIMEDVEEDIEDAREDIEDAKEDIKDAVDDIKISLGKKKRKKNRSESRTTSQFVFAFGINNVADDGSLNSLDDNGIRASNSRFYEWGWTWKTRLLENSPFLNLKYGPSLTYNNLRPENNQYYVKNDRQTVLTAHPQTLTDEAYFRTINLVFPVHLEFDFSKKRTHDDQVVVKTQKGFRVGAGGYAGLNVRSKQILEYKADGLTTEQETRGDYNVNSFVYGVSAYVGYKDLSLYAKYDLNPLFKDNAIDQNNISLGLRFDFH
jgi:hypothetical protein